MAKPSPKTKGKLPTGPHALTLKGERNETKAQEARESPAFEREERRLGIEGHYKGKKMTKPKKKGY